MSLFAKKTLQDIGKGIEYTGYGLLGIASVFGIIAPIVAIIAAASQESKKNSSWRSHSGGGSTFLIFNNFGNSSQVNPAATNPAATNPAATNPAATNPSSNEPIENYFLWSIGLSVLGIILALALEVAWVALMVAGLWVAGAAVLLLGKQVTAYAERQTEDATHAEVSPEKAMPSAPVKVMPSAPVKVMPSAPVKVMPSAPVMQEEPEQIPPGTNTSRRSWSNWWSSLWQNAEPEPGAADLNRTSTIGLI